MIEVSKNKPKKIRSKGVIKTDKIYIEENNTYRTRKWFGFYSEVIANAVGYEHLGFHPDGTPIVKRMFLFKEP